MVEFEGIGATEEGLELEETELDPGLRPKVLDGVEAQRQRASIAAALFGGRGDAARFGRYRLLEGLGAGAMGTVYAAYDEQLDRKVALKVIRPRNAELSLRERTLREARALARLSHPNVVHVYEVGEVEGELFVAMEFLAGPTLRAWMDAKPRPWSETLAVLCAAGEGLAAAHAEGIVHRDFKPHNAMFSADGRVRVLDFGLARIHAQAPAGAQVGQEPGGDLVLTQTGALVGTPAYMAPEQFAAGEVGPYTDQFAFCVVLFEALYGLRPFPGRTVGQLRAAVEAGSLVERPRGSEVPRWVHAVIERGLAGDPDARWPSMEALVAALRRDPGARRRRRWLSSVALAGLALSAGVLLARSSEAPPRQCPDPRATMATLWSEERAQGLREHLERGHGARAEAIMEKVAPRLDDYARGWIEQRDEACRSHAQGLQSKLVYERRTQCLDQRMFGLASFLLELEQTNEETLAATLVLLDELPSLAACADVEELLAAADEGVDQRVWVEHEVLFGDTLESVAARYGASAQGIAGVNLLAPDAELRPGQVLQIRAAHVPLPPHYLHYTVEAGEGWAEVAARFHIDEGALRALNPEVKTLEPGIELLALIIPVPPQPRELEFELELPAGYERARSIEGEHPRLQDGVQLPPNDALYLRRNPALSWSNAVVVEHLPRAIAQLRTRHGFEGTLVIGDISRRGGGPFPPHESHHSGREVDIWLPMLPGVFDATWLEQGRRPVHEEVDWFGTYTLIAALEGTGKVERILLRWEEQAKVHAAGELMGASEAELSRLLTWPRPKNISPDQAGPLVRPDRVHTRQLHVRFAAE